MGTVIVAHINDCCMHKRNFMRHTGIRLPGSSVVAAAPVELLAAPRKKARQADIIKVVLIGCRGMG
jgi:hypothetical protein